jgi:uncharacterized protein YjbI with pentapeptide repeats
MPALNFSEQDLFGKNFSSQNLNGSTFFKTKLFDIADSRMKCIT